MCKLVHLLFSLFSKSLLCGCKCNRSTACCKDNQMYLHPNLYIKHSRTNVWRIPWKIQEIHLFFRLLCLQTPFSHNGSFRLVMGILMEQRYAIWGIKAGVLRNRRSLYEVFIKTQAAINLSHWTLSGDSEPNNRISHKQNCLSRRSLCD